MASAPLRRLRSLDFGSGHPWEEASRRESVTGSMTTSALAAEGGGISAPWEPASLRAARLSAMAWEPLEPHGRGLRLPWARYAAHALTRSLLWRRIAERGGYVALPWSPAKARTGSTVIVWPPPPPYDDDTILVPDLPVYVMIPTLEAVRLPDRTPLPLLSVSINEEEGTYPWTFSAPMRREGLHLIDPSAGGAPPEIEVIVNGYPWRFIVEAHDDNRKFGSNTVTLRGQSRTGLLASPYAPPRTRLETAARTASQLAAEELPVGWHLVWDAVDWLVPGGTFSYADLAPMEAIAQLANAIGATVHSDPAEAELRVAPRYPVSPWGWEDAAPYAVLPAGVLGSGSSSWKGGTNADGVYVFAESAPTGALVKLAGSEGSLQVPMVVDRLLVHADAQRERGRQELAAAGRARTVQRTVPLFPSPSIEGMPDLGVLRRGQLLEVQDTDETWVGQITAVRIDAQRAGQALSVRQHLTIERQYR